MDKIINWIKNNKQLAIIAGILFVFIVLIISALIPDKKNGGVELIEQPLYFYENKRVNIQEKAYEDLTFPKKGINIYKIKKDNYNIKVEGLITLLNIPAPKKNNVGNFLYEWKNKSGDVVQYDVKSQVVAVILQNRVDIFPNVVTPTDSQLQVLLETFVQKYINPNYSYEDVSFVKTGNEIKIEGRRKINGYPLQVPGMEKYSDYILLDENFKLKRARVLLMEVEETPSDKLKILKPDEMNSIASRNTYPREINQGLPEGIISGKPQSVPNNGDDLGIDIPKAASMSMNTMEIVYLFSNVDQNFLTPVYRLTGEGRIVILGQEYAIDTVVNISAIDPNHVYIPSNITYAN